MAEAALRVVRQKLKGRPPPPVRCIGNYVDGAIRVAAVGSIAAIASALITSRQ
jgi:hypothetical protein